jgi:hypothetical protein
MKVFRGQTGSEVRTVRFFLVGQRQFVVVTLLSYGLRALLRVIAVINHLFDLMFDLFLADRSIGVGRVL